MGFEDKTVLVVEDDPASRRLIRAILGASGVRLCEAEDLGTARALLAEALPDLVLLDMRLRDGDGLQLVRELRADPRTRTLPIVAVTAQALKGDEQRILAAGCDHYLAKPIRTHELRALVEQYLGGKRP